MRIRLTSVPVNDQEQALKFYTEMGGTTIATLNDTCGNLVQIYEPA